MMKLRALPPAALAMLAWIATTPASPAFAQLATDMKLEDAGFKMREANTPQKMTRLHGIPPRKFVPHRKNGQLYYVYADPDCRCAFVGDADAMQAYRDMAARRRPQQPDNVGGGGGGINLENEMQAEMNDESGLDIDDIFHPGF